MSTFGMGFLDMQSRLVLVFFRIYNGRHWLSDVAMGAGIGIMSTKIAYWTFPYVQKHFFKSRKDVGAIITPFYNGKQLCLGMVVQFK